jgi:putative transposase
MKTLGLEGVTRGKGVKTTHSDKERCTTDDLVKRQFVAEPPNQLWVADFYLCQHLAGVRLCGIYY